MNPLGFIIKLEMCFSGNILDSSMSKILWKLQIGNTGNITISWWNSDKNILNTNIKWLELFISLIIIANVLNSTSHNNNSWELYNTYVPNSPSTLYIHIDPHNKPMNYIQLSSSLYTWRNMVQCHWASNWWAWDYNPGTLEFQSPSS